MSHSLPGTAAARCRSSLGRRRYRGIFRLPPTALNIINQNERMHPPHHLFRPALKSIADCIVGCQSIRFSAFVVLFVRLFVLAPSHSSVSHFTPPPSPPPSTAHDSYVRHRLWRVLILVSVVIVYCVRETSFSLSGFDRSFSSIFSVFLSRSLVILSFCHTHFFSRPCSIK